MLLLLSKIQRILSKNYPPLNCYESLWRPNSLMERCDCVIWCKFPSSKTPSMEISQRYKFTFEEKNLIDSWVNFKKDK